MAEFGAKIKLSIDTTKVSDLKSQIQEAIDKASEGKKLTLNNVQVSLDQNSVTTFISEIQKKIDNNKFTVKIDKIDATAAMKDLRSQITNVIGTSSTNKTGALINANDIIDSKRIAAAASAAGSAFSSALKTSGNVFSSKEVVEAEAALKQYASAATAAKGQQAQLLEASLQHSAALKQENDQLSQAQKQAANAASVYTRLATTIREIKNIYTGAEKLTGTDRETYQKNAEALAKQWLTVSNQVIQTISSGTGTLPTAQIDALSDSVNKLKGNLTDLKATEQGVVTASQLGSDVTSVTTRLQNLQKQIASIVSAADRMNNTASGRNILTEASTLGKELQTISTMNAQGLFTDADLPRLEALITKVNDLKANLEGLNARETGVAAIDNMAAEITTSATRLENVYKTLNSLKKDAGVLAGTTNGTTIDSEIRMFTTRWQQLSKLTQQDLIRPSNIDALNQLVLGVDNLQQRVKALTASSGSTVTERLTAMQKALEGTVSGTNNIANEQQRNSIIAQRVQLYSQLQTIMNDPSLMTEGNISNLESAVSTFTSNTNLDVMADKVRSVTTAMTDAVSAVGQYSTLDLTQQQNNALTTSQTLLADINNKKAQGAALTADEIIQLQSQVAQYEQMATKVSAQAAAEEKAQLDIMKMVDSTTSASTKLESMVNILKTLSNTSYQLKNASAGEGIRTEIQQILPDLERLYSLSAQGMFTSQNSAELDTLINKVVSLRDHMSELKASEQTQASVSGIAASVESDTYKLDEVINKIKAIKQASESLSDTSTGQAIRDMANGLIPEWQKLMSMSQQELISPNNVARVKDLVSQVGILEDMLTEAANKEQTALDFSNAANGMTSASTQLQNVQRILASIVADSDKIRNTTSGDYFKNQVASFAKEWESLSIAAKNGILSDADSARLDALVNGARNLKAEIDSVINAEKGATFDSTNIDKLNNALQTLKQLRTETNDISNESQRNALLEQQKALYDQIIAAQQDSKIFTDNAAVSDLAGQANLQQLEVYIARLTELRTTVQNTKIDSTDLSGLSNQQNLLNSIDTLLSQANQLKQQGVSIDATAVANLAAQTTQHASNVAQLQKEVELYSQVATLRNKIATYLSNNPRVASSGSDQFYNILNRLSTGAIDLSQANAEFNTLASTFHAAGLEGQTFTQQMSAGWRKFGGWSIVTRTFMTVISTIKKMVSSVKELDAAMTELKKVTSLTDTQYSQFFDTAAATAKSIGATVSDTINATADFARLGYDVDEAAELAEAALVYKNVGDGIEDVSDASESLISTLAAFGIAADDAMSIVDKFNEVGNNYAISSVGIGEALERSAAAFAAAGNTLDESIGMVTAMNEIIQNPETVGTAAKTLTMYLRASKTEAEEAGIATDGMADSVSELRDELMSLTGVDIMLDDDTYKSTFQIMKEISAVWDDLSDVSQANVLNLLGGKRGANSISALITNFQTAEEAAKTSADSTGSAYKENEKYLDSVAGKTAELSAAFEELSNAVINSEVLKFGTSVVTVITQIATALAKIGLLLPAIAGSLASITIFKQRSAAINIVSQFETMTRNGASMATMMSTLSAQTVKFNTYQKNTLTTALQNSAAYQALTAAEKAELAAKLGLNTATQAQTVTTAGLTATVGASTTAFHGFTASVKAAWGALSMLQKASLVIAVISTLVTWISAAVNKVKEAREEAIETANEIAEAYSDAQDTYNTNMDTLNGLKDEFNTLAKGVGKNGENVGLTAEEYERYWDIVNQIVDISPNLVSGYDAEGRAIVDYTNLLTLACNEQERFLNNQEQQYLGSGEDYFEGQKESYKEALSNIKKLAKDDLLDVLKPTFGENFLGKDSGKAKISAMNSALRAIGVINTSEEQLKNDAAKIFSENADLIYQNSREFINTLKLTGAYTEEELVEAEGVIRNMTGYYSEMDEIVQNQADYLMAYFSSSDDTAIMSWFNQIPVAAMSAFEEGLQGVVDPYASAAENIVNATNFGEEFAAAIQSESGQALTEMAKGLEDGTVSLTEYDAAVAAFNKEVGGSAGGAAAVDYFNNLSNGYSNLDDSSAKALKSVDSIKKVTESISDCYDLLEQAQEDMDENGGLSLDTINSLAGSLEDGENIADYLYVENGAIKLNIEMWKQRADAIAQSNIDNLQNNIDVLEAQKASLWNQWEEAKRKGEDTTEIDNQIAANQEDIDNATELLGIYQGIAGIAGIENDDPFGFDKLSEGMDEVTSAAEMLQNMDSGEDYIGTLESIMSFVENHQGFSLDNFLNADGSFVDSSTVAELVLNALIADLEKLDGWKPEFGEHIKEEFRESVSGAEAFSDAIGDAEDAMDMLNKIKEGDDYLGSLQDVMDFISEHDGFTMADFFGEDGEFLDVDDAMIDKVIDSIIASLQEFDDWDPKFEEPIRQKLKEVALDVEETNDKVEKLKSSLEAVGDMNSFVGDINSGDSTVLEQIQAAMDLAEQFKDENGDTYDWTKWISSVNDDGSISWNTELLREMSDAQVDAAFSAAGLGEEWDTVKQKIKDSAFAVAEETSALDQLDNALTSVSDVSDFMTDINDEDSTIVDQLQSAISLSEQLADSTGKPADWTSWIKGLSSDGSTIEWNTEAIRALSDAQVDAALSAYNLEEKYPGLTQQIKDSAAAAAVAASALEKLESASDKVQGALDVSANYGGYTEIGYSDYASLIETDTRYAAAIEYQNGVMTLNSEKHEEITNQILNETKQMAEAEKQAILTSDEYVNLTKAMSEGTITSAESKRLSELNSQITGFDVLTHEIDGATDAYHRWINRKGDDGMDRFTQAQEAFELINDTLNDKESEYYGRIGREEFDQAVEFVIGDNVEVDTPEFDAAFKRAKSYLKDGATGVNNFIDDLIEQGVVDTTTNTIDSTVAQIADSLGITEELVQAMIDRYNEYQPEEKKLEVKEPEISDDTEDKIHGLAGAYDELTDAESKVSGLAPDIASSVADEASLEDTIQTLDDAYAAIETINATPLNIQIDPMVLANLETLRQKLTEIAEQKNTISLATNMANTTSPTINSEQITEAVKQIKDAVDTLNNIEITLGVDGATSNLSGLETAAANAKAAIDEISTACTTVSGLIGIINSKQISVNTGSSVSRIGAVSSALSSVISRLNSIYARRNITVRINEITTKTTVSRAGASGINNAAYASGTAMASGGKTLVGELGMETVVDPNTNIWYTVGEHGAEFVTLPKNAIVFNHRQTKELLGTGSVSSRGDAMASGNAAANLLTTLWNGVKSVAKKVASDVKKSTKDSDTVKGNISKVNGGKSSGKGSGGGGGGGGSSSKSSSDLEKLQEQYEEIDKQLEHLIAHQEFLYEQAERGYDFTGMQNSLDEQVRIYKDKMQNALDAVEAMKAAGADDTSEELQAMEEMYWEATNNMYEALEKINDLYIDALNDKIDGVQKAYNTLADAADEFNNDGGISVDTFQSLTENGSKYLSCLENVNGQFVINKDAIKDMIAAEKEQLAVESALSYLQQISQHLTDGNTNALAELVNLTGKVTDNTWNAVYAQAALLKAAGLTDEQFKQVVFNLDAMRAIAQGVSSDLDSASNSTSSAYKDQKESLDEILDLTEDLVKYETEEKIDAINDEIDAYKKIIDLKKESLQTTKDENDYEKDLADKVKEIAKLQSQIDQLSLDDSREAKAERASLLEDLADLQDELAEYQGDHAYDTQVDTLDQMADDYEESRNAEIETLENSISSAEKIYQLAIERIGTSWDTLYTDIIAWNTEAGSSLNSEITENWLKAADAVKQYGDYLTALNALKEATGESSSSTTETTSSNVVATGDLTDTDALIEKYAPKEEETTTEETTEPETTTVQKVKVVKGQWYVRKGAGKSNKSYGVAHTGDTFEYLGKSGSWYKIQYGDKEAWISSKGSSIIEEEVPKYHTGGLVGGSSSANEEVLALLQTGETVLTEQQTNGLYKIVDFQQALAEKLGHAIGNISAMASAFAPSFAGVGADLSKVGSTENFVFSPSINVAISGANTSDSSAIKSYGEKIANTTLDLLYDTFTRRGISISTGGKLKQ